MIEAAIFDMDGLLIDSEPLWREAEKSTLQRVGIELTGEMCHETLGLRTDEAVSHWYDKFPWTGLSQEEVERQLLATIRKLILSQGRPMSGVFETLNALRDADVKLGIASSSPHHLIETVVRKLDFCNYFSVMSSAADENHGKPDPAVYLSAARRLSVNPKNCLAFEDSMSGVQSVKSAGMRVIAVPEEHHFYEPAFDLADIKLRSLQDFSLNMVSELSEPGSA